MFRDDQKFIEDNISLLADIKKKFIEDNISLLVDIKECIKEPQQNEKQYVTVIVNKHDGEYSVFSAPVETINVLAFARFVIELTEKYGEENITIEWS